MSSQKQIEANRRNAVNSTGPKTPEGKRRSRCNAVRHGLTAETVIVGLEDVEDYDAFQAAVISDYDAESAVEREMVLRLASILWRLRRATAIETALFNFATKEADKKDDEPLPCTCSAVAGLLEQHESDIEAIPDSNELSGHDTVCRSSENIANNYLRLIALPTFPLDRLSRYEHILWRQARQIIFSLETLRRRKPSPYRASFPFSFRTKSR
jgi:hypothetical protein